MRFNGGQFDGEVDESCAEGEELTAEWNDSQQLYLVYDEDNEPRGAIKHAGFRVRFAPDGTPQILPDELPKPWYRNRQMLPFGFALPAALMFLASSFCDTSSRIGLLTTAFVLLLMAFQIAAQVWR